jgi:NAD(P)-dependent dehydrogenase (short-subunit alcohol dehydrogenase family)
MNLHGKTAVVTGGCGGIGSAVCIRLAQQGAAIAVLDIADPTSLEQNLRDSAAGPGSTGFWYRHTDLADPPEIQAAFAELDSIDATVAVLVNVAGIGYATPFLDVTVDEWNRTLDINARGLFLTSQEVARRMKTAGEGRIINILSTASTQGFAYGSTYCASKGAGLLITRTLAIELGPHNITVNAIAPGTIRTPMSEDYIANTDIAQPELARTHSAASANPKTSPKPFAFSPPALPGSLVRP